MIGDSYNGGDDAPLVLDRMAAVLMRVRDVVVSMASRRKTGRTDKCVWGWIL